MFLVRGLPQRLGWKGQIFDNPRFQDIPRLLSSLMQEQMVFPVLRLLEEKERFILEAKMPGVAPADLKVTVQGKTLYLEGERKALEAAEGGRYHRQERNFGTFSRAITLPVEIDASQVKASQEDGMLRMVLPKDKAVLPRRIEIT